MVPYVEIFRALQEASVRYVVAGGIAVNLHGVERATADLDLVIHLEEENTRKFAQVMTQLGYRPRVPVAAEDLAKTELRQQWITEKNMLVFSFYHPQEPMEMVDVFVKEPLPFEDLYNRRVLREAFGVTISVMGLRDLITIKREAGRPKDLVDVSFLTTLMKQDDENH